MVSNLYPFQLKEKKEKFETEQAKKKEDFKSGRIVGKVCVNAAYINSLQHTMYTAVLLFTMYLLWFNFILGLIFISLCFKLIITHYHAQKQREIKIKPRIKLNHNISIHNGYDRGQN